MVMGTKKDTVKITKNGVGYLFFKQTPEQVDNLTQFEVLEISIVGSTNINEYGGMVSPQIFVKDYELKDGRFSF